MPNSESRARVPAANKIWLGYSLHHRSGVFKTGSQFGHIRGGSNYNSIYLQFHY
jgi:outer membrane protein